MRYQLIVIASLCAVMSMPAVASAQTPRVEVSGIFGWSISDGIEGDGILAGDGNIYNAIDIQDSVSWGFGVGFNINETNEVGFLFNQQMSTLRVLGTADREIGDMAVTSYHPYFAYNFANNERVRPFVLIGLGATTYASVPFTRVNGQSAETDGNTQFSGTLGAGVKFFPSPKVGLRVSAAWTPTYITTESAGWYCDPYWGCYAAGDAKYANQITFNGGITFRF